VPRASAPSVLYVAEDVQLTIQFAEWMHRK
jgi:hypothetical protein